MYVTLRCWNYSGDCRPQIVFSRAACWSALFSSISKARYEIWKKDFGSKCGLIREDTSVTSIELHKSRTLRSKAIPCTCLERTRAFQETEAPIFHDSQHMKMVSPMHCHLYLQEICLVIISVRVWVGPGYTVRSEGMYQCEIPVTPLVIVPETFRLLDQCLNRLQHRVSKITEQLCTPFNTSVRR
jgi:hypothetical protein